MQFVTTTATKRRCPRGVRPDPLRLLAAVYGVRLTRVRDGGGKTLMLTRQLETRVPVQVRASARL